VCRQQDVVGYRTKCGTTGASGERGTKRKYKPAERKKQEKQHHKIWWTKIASGSAMENHNHKRPKVKCGHRTREKHGREETDYRQEKGDDDASFNKRRRHATNGLKVRWHVMTECAEKDRSRGKEMREEVAREADQLCRHNTNTE
jgi:hypothetical protein